MLEELIIKSTSLGIITACDVERHTATELLIMIIKRLNEVIEISKQQQEILVGLVKDGLNNVLVEIIQDMLDNGQLSDLIVEGLTQAKERTRTFNIKIDGGAKGDGTTDDTKAFQNAMDILPDGWTLLVPQGRYLVTQLVINGKRDVHRYLRMEGSNYLPTTREGDNNWVGGATYIVHNGNNGTPLFITGGSINKVPSLYFSNIGFLGTNGNINSQDFQTKRFMYNQKDIDADLRCGWGSCSCDKCYFWGFKTVFGEFREVDYGGVNDLAEDIGQQAVFLTECEFFRNKHAISQIIDSYVNKCRFASNERAIVLRHWGFANRIIDNRIEWNIKEGIYCYRGGGIFSNNEFDRNGYAGFYGCRMLNSIISDNKFLRNGAHETDTLNNTQNLHLYLEECQDTTVTGNTTAVERQWDTGVGKIVPLNACRLVKNKNCVITGNVFKGGNNQWNSKNSLFACVENLDCIIENNKSVDSFKVTTHKQPSFVETIESSGEKYFAVGGIEIPNTTLRFTDVHYLHIYVDASPSDTNIGYATFGHYIMPIYLWNTGEQSGYMRGTLIKLYGAEVNYIGVKTIDYFINAHILGVTIQNNYEQEIKVYVELD